MRWASDELRRGLSEAVVRPDSVGFPAARGFPDPVGLAVPVDLPAPVGFPAARGLPVPVGLRVPVGLPDPVGLRVPVDLPAPAGRLPPREPADPLELPVRRLAVPPLVGARRADFFAPESRDRPPEADDSDTWDSIQRLAVQSPVKWWRRAIRLNDTDSVGRLPTSKL